MAGVTGAPDDLPPDLAAFVGRARAVARRLGRGLRHRHADQARAVGQMADGVIVGSALIDAVTGAADPAGAASAFVSGLHARARHA